MLQWVSLGANLYGCVRGHIIAAVHDVRKGSYWYHFGSFKDPSSEFVC